MGQMLSLGKERLQLLLDTAAEGIYGIDLQGNCTFSNLSCITMLGYKTVEDVVGKNMHSLIHHAYSDGTPMPVQSCWIFRAFAEGIGTHRDDEVLWRADGSFFPVEYWSYPQVENGAVTGAVVTFIDISKRKKALEELRASEQRYRLLGENITDVIWTLDKDFRFTYISPSIERLRGFSVEEAMAQTLEESLTKESMAIVNAEMAKSAEALRVGNRYPNIRGEFEQPCKDGSTVWVEAMISGMYDDDGRLISILGVSRDVTERRHIQERLAFMAQHDPLTGLANRALFSDRLERAIALAKRERRNLALLFIDLDKFKPVNDNYGHAVGDQMLQEVARRLSASVRASDTIGRIGGDEFLVLLPGAIGETGAIQVSEKILKALRDPFMIDHVVLFISSTIGIALFPEHGPDGIILTGNADKAMYNAKKNGGNSVCVFRHNL